MVQRQTLQQGRRQGGSAAGAAGSAPPPPTTHRMRQEQSADRAQPALMASSAAHGRVAPPRPKRRRPPAPSSSWGCWSFCKGFAAVGLVLLFVLVEIAENGPAFWHIKSHGGNGRPELAMRLLYQPNANGTGMSTNMTAAAGEPELGPHEWLQAAGLERRWRKILALLQTLREVMEAYMFHKDPAYARGGGETIHPQQQVSTSQLNTTSATAVY